MRSSTASLLRGSQQQVCQDTHHNHVLVYQSHSYTHTDAHTLRNTHMCIISLKVNCKLMRLKAHLQLLTHQDIQTHTHTHKHTHTYTHTHTPHNHTHTQHLLITNVKHYTHTHTRYTHTHTDVHAIHSLAQQCGQLPILLQYVNVCSERRPLEVEAELTTPTQTLGFFAFSFAFSFALPFLVVVIIIIVGVGDSER